MKALLYSSSSAMRGIVLLLCVLLLFIAPWKAAPTARASGCGATIFTYTATSANTSGYITLNTLYTDNTPDILLEVSQFYTGA
jgi:hypothetical protein